MWFGLHSAWILYFFIERKMESQNKKERGRARERESIDMRIVFGAEHL